MFAGIEDGRYKATDDWWIKSLTQFQQLSGYFQENFAGASTDGVLALYSQGKAAILPTGTYQIAQVRKAGGAFPNRSGAADHDRRRGHARPMTVSSTPPSSWA